MAINCSLNKDLLRSNTCAYSLPEVVTIYLANFGDVTTSVGVDSAGCESISAITMATGATFYKIEPAKNSASFTDELVVEDNGNKHRTHTLTFNVTGKYDECMKPVFDALSLGKYFAVVYTADGTYLALGRLTGVEAETATLAGGGDSNGISIVLSANVTESVTPLTGTAITTVTGA